MSDANLFTTLRTGFPDDAQAIALEVVDGARLEHHRWHDLDRASAMIANLWGFLELAPGSRVLVQLDPSAEALLVQLAVLRAGLVLVPVPPRDDPAPDPALLAEAGAVVCPRRHFSRLSRRAFQAGVRYVLTLDADRSGTLLDRAAQQPDAQTPVPRDAEAPACVVPDGAEARVLSPRRLLARARALAAPWQPSDVVLHARPAFDADGPCSTLNAALLRGCRSLWLPRFDAPAFAARVPAASVVLVEPAHVHALLAEPTFTREACRDVRLFMAAPGPWAAGQREALHERTGQAIAPWPGTPPD